MIKRALQMLPGVLLFLLGLSAVVGWLAKIPVLLRPDISFMPISFGGAVCFCLSGVGLLCFAFSSRYCRYIQIASGCLLFLISALVITEYLFHVDLGIDHLVSTDWITDDSIYSGRVALNTAISFLLSGVIFILFSFASKKPAAVIIEISIFVLFLIGMLSGLGYFFNIELLYSWSASTRMSIYSAVIFTLLSICFWYFWRQYVFFMAEKGFNEINTRLKKSEARYALAVRGSSAGLWDWEVGTDNIFYSPYLKNLLGYTDEELPNSIQSFSNLLHPDDASRASMAMREHILHHVPYRVEYRLKRKSGEYHWFQVVGQAEWDERGLATRVAGSISDVTERKVNERRLSMQYAVTQILSEAENVDDALSRIVHIICMGLDWDYGAIWLVNHEKNQLDYVSSWHHNNNEIDQFLLDRRKTTFSPGTGVLGRVWRSGKPYWNEDVTEDLNFLHKDAAKKAHLYSGFYFPMRLQNNVFGVMEFYSPQIESPDERLLQMMAAIGPQISQFIQRKHVEDELRQSEAHKSAILNSASDGIITISDDGLIVSFNLQTEKMFGYPETELRNKNINDLIPGVTDRVSEIVNTLPVEFLSVDKNGDHFPAELTVSGMQMNGKNIYVLIVRDITERKKIEQLKNEFVSVVSHELRTPLTSIRGSLGLVLGGVVGSFSDKAKNLLDIANNNCERLLHLINDILDIEKIESGKMNFHFDRVDISKIVNESISANQMYGEKFGVRIALVESVSDIFVNVDPDRMLQVMANLVSNAVKFSKQGDSVDVAIRVLNNKVRVSVIDHGPGIPVDFQSMVFQKFSQADTTTTRGKGGTGLGLNITKSIIEKFGGTIDFVSEANKKTVFYFDLPVANENNKPEDEKIPVSTRKSLLVCEDDEDQAQYIKAMLESAGFDVDIALTAQEARQSVSKKNYQGLLLDLILPDQDGISFIRELRGSSRTKDLPIIVMSVIAKTGHSLLNGDAFTVLDWLDKPVDFSKLLKSVSSLKKKNAHVPLVMHVEDDVEARKIIQTLLHDVATVVCAKTLQEAKIRLMKESFDLVILDLLLPDGKGTELLPLLAKSATPVIVFSAVELDREHSEFVKNAFVKSETSHEKLFDMIEKIIHQVP